MSNSDWQTAAIELKKQGLSSRKIGNILGRGKSTINDMLKRVGFNEEESTVKQGPRILVYDIETSPIVAHMWSMWQQGFGLNQIETDWFIMSFCCKWLGEDDIYYFDQRDAENIEDDSLLLEKLWKFLNEADVVIGQNIKKFDTRKVNTRFVMNGLPKPSAYRQIDTLTIIKEQFAMTSGKLEYVAGKLCPEHMKSKHLEYPGHELWNACLKGDRKAWECMENYNREDVLATETLYNVLSSWDNKLPNFDVYVDEVLDMSEWEKDGFHYSNLGKYQRYRNKKTGVQRRSRINLLTKEKRDSLLSNIV